MDNTLKNMGQRVFSAVVAAATILSMMGIAAFAVPQQAQAAGAGDLVKASLSAVYFVGYDGARYTFPNSATYNTWFTDFNDVMTISDSAMADIALGGNVVMRAGSTWIKIQSSNKTYAVSTDGMIHWVESEEVAEGLAGSDWNTMIMDVPDTFFVDYTAGTSLSSSSLWEGALYMDGSHEMIIWGGEARMLTGDAADDNHFMSEYFLDGADIDASAYSAGDDIDGMVCDLVDASQTGCTSVSASGDVEVSLSSSTPAGATLPKGANSVEVLEIDLEAGSEDANVNILTFEMEGPAATTNISNVYLYEGATRLTESRSVNASTSSVTFGSLDLDIEAGEERTLSLRVELSSSASAGDEFYFSILSDSDVTTDGDVDGSFPIDGNTFSVANVSAGSVTLTKNGTISNPSLGEDDATIGQFKLVANTEDAELMEITLKVDNAADHDDFMLWDGDDMLAEGEYIGDKLVMFDLSDAFSIEEGNSDTFKVTADIGGEASDDVKVYLDNSADLLAVGGDYGFGVSVTNSSYDGTSCTTSSGSCSYSSIDGGEITINLSNTVTAGDLRINSQDQVMGEFTITAAEAVTVKDLDVIIYGDDNANNDPFDGTESGNDDDDTGLINGDDDGSADSSDEASVSDMKIVNAETDMVLMGPLELDSAVVGGDDADQTLDFSDDFTMEAGETLTLQFVADFDDGITSGTDFGFAIDISGFVAEDVNGDTITNADYVVPTTDIQSYVQELNSASLTNSLASIPGDTTTVQGTDEVHVQSFSMVGGDAGEVNISDVTISIYAHDAASGTFSLGDCPTDAGACDAGGGAIDVNTYIESCSIYDIGGTLLDGPEAPSANGQTMSFEDVDWTIAASETERLDVYCDVANPSTSTVGYFAFDINDVSEDVIAEDEDNTDIDGSTDDPNGATSPTNVVTVAASGSLSLAAASSTPSADYVLTGSADNLVSTFEFTATNEDFYIHKLTLTEESAEAVNGTSNSSAYTNNVETLTIEYPAADGNMYTKTTTFASTNEAAVNFAGTTEEPYMYVDTEDEAEFNVYVDVPSSDRVTGGSSTSNERIEIGVSVDTTNDDQFKAVGVGSGTSLDDDDISANSAANRFVVRETAPVITLSTDSPSGTGFVPGDQEVLRFNIAANANEDVIFNEFVFSFSATDNDGTESTTDNEPDWNECDSNVSSGFGIYESMLDIYDLNDEGLTTALDVDADWTILGTNGADCSSTQADVGFFELDLTTPLVIPAGDVHSIALYFDSSRANAVNDDSLQVSLTSEMFSSASYLTSSNTDGAVLVTDTTITVSSGTAYSAGDVLCFDTGDDVCDASDEKALVTSKSGNDLTVIRAVNGTTASAVADGVDVDYVHSSVFWQDDGTTSVSTEAEEYWGAYLVDDLPVTGGAMGF